jgi:fructose-1,6-bisphosphatase/sedoheptulose 1,7-bisphosphatase-like protein
MDKTIFCVMGICLGFVLASVYFEHEIDKTGVLQLDVKTYTCREYKEEMLK